MNVCPCSYTTPYATPEQFALVFYNTTYTDRERVDLMVRWVEEHFANFDLSAVDKLLESVDIYRAEPQLLVCLLRTAYRAKEYLPNWFTLRDQLFATMEDNLKTRRLFAGLLTNELPQEQFLPIPGTPFIPVGVRLFSGEKLFQLKATHGLPLAVALETIWTTSQLIKIDWAEYIETARANGWWDFQIYEEVKNALVDIAVRKEAQHSILNRLKLYILQNPHPKTQQKD